MIANYKVTGMTCEHCVAHVTEEVSALKGVDDVKVTLADGALQVTSASPIDFGAVKEAVSEAGDYEVQPA
ncbi:heavy-metal-associated domain-containing protein [Propionibacterium sp.]|uniref:heavy-metal-associated domain-containing protein n=1 Tax=Propionibacterium sp. TaxID=1977903 RepID=UPI0039EA9E96